MTDRSQTTLDRAKEAADLANEAFACGNNVVGIAAVTLAAQLMQLARLQERMKG